MIRPDLSPQKVAAMCALLAATLLGLFAWQCRPTPPPPAPYTPTVVVLPTSAPAATLVTLVAGSPVPHRTRTPSVYVVDEPIVRTPTSTPAPTRTPTREPTSTPAPTATPDRPPIQKG